MENIIIRFKTIFKVFNRGYWSICFIALMTPESCRVKRINNCRKKRMEEELQMEELIKRDTQLKIEREIQKQSRKEEKERKNLEIQKRIKQLYKDKLNSK